MRLSTRSRYGVRLMLSLALNEGAGPRYLKDIARDEDISVQYLGQIVIPLRAKGLVNTFRGAHGGYQLGRPASEITLMDVIEPLEGDLSLIDCVGNPLACGRSKECVTRDVWDELSALMREYLESVTLDALARRCGKRRPGPVVTQ